MGVCKGSGGAVGGVMGGRCLGWRQIGECAEGSVGRWVGGWG